MSKGSTPAYAGKRGRLCSDLGTTRDHPRVCGEKTTVATAAVWLPGSPPRMRGKAFRRCRRTSSCRDHPRVCGEKDPKRPASGFNTGSPPRMRGKAGGFGWWDRGVGITPAYAGKSQQRHHHRRPDRDHPRVCGEKLLVLFFQRGEPGSPPRMRGKVEQLKPKGIPVGITPAYAGKRLKRSPRIGHFSCILCLFHSVLHRASASGGSRAGPCAPPCLPAQNAVPV